MRNAILWAGHGETTALAPTILSIRTLDETNVVVGFTSATALLYDLQARSNLTSGAWSSVVSNVVGTGQTLWITNAAPPSTREHVYRVD